MIHQPYPPKNTTCTIRPSPQPITLWAAAPGTTNIKGDSLPEPKSFLARPFPQITAMTQGSMDHGNGTHLYHLDLSSDASRYSSIIPISICNFHPSACTQRAKKVNKTFLSLLHAAAAAGLSSKELSLNFHPVSVFRWELQRRKEGGLVVCVQSGPLQKIWWLSQCSLWWDLSQDTDACSEMASYLMSLSSSRVAHKAALPSILCLFATTSPTLAVSLTQHWAMCLPTASMWHWCVSQEGCVSCR